MIEPRHADLLDGLFSARVSSLADAFRSEFTDVSAEERAHVDGAVAKRAWEFLTARSLAHRLLRAEGRDVPALLPDSDRVPLWPQGIVGSISHTTTARFPRAARATKATAARLRATSLCVVAISARLRGLGVDVEPDAPVEAGIERQVCRPGELAWLACDDAVERARRCRVVFSAKEAVYKAFYPRVRTFWSFQDVGVEIDLATERFVARLPASAGREVIEGRVRRREGWIVSAVEDA